MISLTEYISLTEVIWVVVAIPGLILWVLNRRNAVKSVVALRMVKQGNGRMLWAKFSLLLTNVFIVVELVLIVTGAVAMFRQNVMDFRLSTQLTTIVAVILASGMVSYTAFRWRAVDETLIDMARQRRTAETQPPPAPPPDA